MADIEKRNVAGAGPGAGPGVGPGVGANNVDGTNYWQNVGRVHNHRIANPGPLGLLSFAGTTLLLSFINVGTRDVTQPNVVVGMAIFVGGLAQFLAGMWEFACGNTFGATAFTSYGAFWLSYATIFIPGSGIAAAFTMAPDETHNALGLYLIIWFIFTAFLTIAALRRNIGFILLLGFLTLTFLLLGIAEFTGKAAITKAGGAFGIITAFIAYYCAMAELLRPDDAWFTLPLGQIPKRVD